MQIYHYHPETGEYKGEGEAQPSPLDEPGVYLIPAYATAIEPPNLIIGFAPCFENGEWRQVEDHRGKTIYNTADASRMKVTDLGPLPEGYTNQVPCEYPKWDGEKWITDEAARLVADAQARLSYNDNVAIRCVKAGVPYTWDDYDGQLRAIVRGESSGPLPDRPPYPPGS